VTVLLRRSLVRQSVDLIVYKNLEPIYERQVPMEQSKLSSMSTEQIQMNVAELSDNFAARLDDTRHTFGLHTSTTGVVLSVEPFAAASTFACKCVNKPSEF
jgi:hypothetical protein